MAPRSLRDAPARGWGAGWPNCPGTAQLSYAHGGGVSVIVRRELVSLVGWLLEQTTLLGYVLHQEQTGAFNCRPMKYVAGGYSNTPSNHSWGLALDLNWNQNGFGHNAAHNIPDQVVQLWESHGFNWGGHWTAQAPDFMHFEFNGTIADANLYTVALTDDEQDDDMTPEQMKLVLHEFVHQFFEEQSEPWISYRQDFRFQVQEAMKRK